MTKTNLKDSISRAQAVIDAVEIVGMSKIEAAIKWEFDYESAKQALPEMLRMRRGK